MSLMLLPPAVPRSVQAVGPLLLINGTGRCVSQEGNNRDDGWGASMRRKQSNHLVWILRRNHQEKPSEETIRRNHQEKPSGETIRRNHREKPSGETIGRNHQEKPSGETIRRNHREKPSGETIRRNHREKPSGETIRRNQQEKPSGETIRRNHQEKPSGETIGRNHREKPSGETIGRNHQEKPTGETILTPVWESGSSSENPENQCFTNESERFGRKSTITKETGDCRTFVTTCESLHGTCHLQTLSLENNTRHPMSPIMSRAFYKDLFIWVCKAAINSWRSVIVWLL